MLLQKIVNIIINPVIVLGFIIATIYFFITVIQFIASADNDGERQKNKDAVMYGVIGLFVMFSVYGILRFILATFNVPCSGFFFC